MAAPGGIGGPSPGPEMAASPDRAWAAPSSIALSASEARGLSLTEIAAVKFNRDADPDDSQRVLRGSDVTLTSRSVGERAWVQLVASAGLTTDQARDLSLSDIAAAKFDRDTDN
jgi:hypothetical protein